MWVGEGDLRVLVCILQELIKCRGSFRVVQAIESWTMGMEVYRIWRFRRQIRTFLGASVGVSVQWYNLSWKMVTLVLAISPGELAEKNQNLTGAV